MPLSFAITINWDALIQAGEHTEGHCLWRGDWAREQYLRAELRRACRQAGHPFAAVWGRDVGAQAGVHVHVSMFWKCLDLAALVEVLARVTGSPAEYVLKPHAADTVARSVCGGWQIDMNGRGRDGAKELADYIATQDEKHPTPPILPGKAFGVSEAIGKTARMRWCERK